MRRVGFVSIQNNHSVACTGYKANYVRTGYEHIVSRRAGTGFSNIAKDDGTVTSVSAEGIIVKYKDGTEEGYQLGRRYGNSGGLTLAHEMTTNLTVGQKFKKDSVLTYHPGFFDKDRFDPSNVVFKMGTVARVALLESKKTHEDASSISKELASRLQTKTTKVKDVVISFDQKVSNVVTANTAVVHDTVLCMIEDKTTANSNLFDEASLNTLRLLSSQAPTAKVNGILERVEVYYNGDKEDMHESIRTLATASDRNFSMRFRAQGKTAMTGEVDESFRVEGEPLLLDTVCIRFYITSDISHGVGDKVVFSNQLKSVVSEIMENEVKTETGETVDAIFGAQSVFNRIVVSPFIIGTTNVLLSIISKNAAKIYKGEMKS